VSQRKRSAERREGAPDEPARPAAAGSDGRSPGTPGSPPAEARPTDRASTDGEASVEEQAPGGEVSVEDTADEGERAEGDMAAVVAERDEYLALAQRTQADFENYRKRATRELAAAGVRGKAELARELLPVIDNLERALESTDEGEAGLAEGVRLVLSELTAALERNGVSPIQPVGEPFDPNLHEALSTRAENGAEAGVVLDVIQKGYRLDQTVLRPARVVVSA
jgi:molecular chaperone GrpE